MFRANATEGDDTADNVYYQVFASDEGPVPAGMVANQQFDCIIHVFYNMQPNPDWLFSRDGEHPLP